MELVLLPCNGDTKYFKIVNNIRLILPFKMEIPLTQRKHEEIILKNWVSKIFTYLMCMCVWLSVTKYNMCVQELKEVRTGVRFPETRVDKVVNNHGGAGNWT